MSTSAVTRRPATAVPSSNGQHRPWQPGAPVSPALNNLDGRCWKRPAFAGPVEQPGVAADASATRAESGGTPVGMDRIAARRGTCRGAVRGHGRGRVAGRRSVVRQTPLERRRLFVPLAGRRRPAGAPLTPTLSVRPRAKGAPSARKPTPRTPQLAATGRISSHRSPARVTTSIANAVSNGGERFPDNLSGKRLQYSTALNNTVDTRICSGQHRGVFAAIFIVEKAGNRQPTFLVQTKNRELELEL